MSRPLLILLLSTGALLITTEGQQSFHTLPQLYKKTINLAIQHANKGAQQHMNYHGVLTYKEPFINCVVCCNRSGTELQKPFIDCIRHKEVSSRTEIREKTCSQLKPHLPGSGSIMTQKTASSETQTNCLGCF
ncbi:uncharacterized protein LOC118771439 isoform X2 [Megalops cyprinoides]|uniref:uncharacterized protein LOC118771439 isoform X2 n=1 Tax=Megalops cyprinoides TaxID=118141 RepID=UPI001864136D|nr:uncharacterized protein LOC118771439 isoform X2 [Megalops cyprinoides]